MDMLIHTCCAICLIGPYHELADAGHRVRGYFYNPNIHPLIEFRRRLKAVKVLRDRMKIDVICEEEYGLNKFLREVDWESGSRCSDCYVLRLQHTARRAAEEGCDAFTTTLFTSIHQDHELIKKAGREFGRQYDVEFVEKDWRELHETNVEEARRMNLYRQQYCGCVFSEYERYCDTGRHLYGGPGGD
ncbi:MAG: epoxyqueuosine reductase QueH [Candidatus Brocadiia bacterium]